MFKKIKLTIVAGALSMLALACGGSSVSISVLPSIEAHSQNRIVSRDIDILFVIDDSGSMANIQQNLRDNFEDFIQSFYATGFDFRVAVVKTSAFGVPTVQNSGGNTYYEAGKTVHEFRCGAGNNCGAGPSTFGRACTGSYGNTNTTNGNGTPAIGTDHILSSEDLTESEMVAKFKRNADVGLCGDGNERAFQSTETVLRNMATVYNTAATKFPRENAHFAVIHVGDEPDGKWSGSNSSNTNGSLNAHDFADIHKAPEAGNNGQNILAVRSYLDALRRHDESATLSVHAIQYLDTATCNNSATYVGHPQIYMAEAVDGKTISVCGDFAADLQDLGDHIVELASEFYLNSTDIIEETLRVYVNEDEVFRNESPGATVGFTYRNDPPRVIFLSGSRPAEGAEVGVAFTGRFLGGN